MTSGPVLGFLMNRSEDIWTCFSSEEADEAVFSVLNLDHDSFLLELNEKGTVPSSNLNLNRASNNFDVYPPSHNHDHIPPSTLDTGIFSPLGVAQTSNNTEKDHNVQCDDNSSPSIKSQKEIFEESLRREKRFEKMQRVRARIVADISRGQSCDMLRANIKALRLFKPKEYADRPVSDTRADSRAASIVQSAWRCYVYRHVFLHLREIVRKFSVSSPRGALQTVNPREANLADAASDIVVRFRLAADDSCYLPVVVYKVFTRRPVIDVCRGCCGRLLHCSADRAAATPKPGSAPAAVPAVLPCARGCGDCRPRSVCCMLFASYKRVENNNWRLCHVGLFDPRRCPARGRGRLRSGRAGQAMQADNPPGASGGAVRRGARRSSVQDKARDNKPTDQERPAKIAQLRKLYGFREEMQCPPPPPTATTKTMNLTTATDGTATHRAAAGEDEKVLGPAGPPVVSQVGPAVDFPAQTVSDPGRTGSALGQLETWSRSQARVGDIYYDHLLAAWGL